MLAPLELQLPDMKTLGELWAASSVKYARLQLQRSCRRVSYLRRLASKQIELVPESPCASRFSSFSSATSASELRLNSSLKSTGTIKGVRDGLSWDAAAFSGKTLLGTP